MTYRLSSPQLPKLFTQPSNDDSCAKSERHNVEQRRLTTTHDSKSHKRHQQTQAIRCSTDMSTVSIICLKQE